MTGYFRCALCAGVLLGCLLFVSCGTLPEVVTDAQSPAARELVDLRKAEAGLKFDVRYASAANFTHERLYPTPDVYLRKDAAAALLRVQRDLRKDGLGLKIFDGYRPYHVQQKMWDLVRDERYVSNPAKTAGRHTRGTAIDVTLVDRSGRELPMPTAYDDFTERAHREAAGIPDAARANSKRLESAMARHGFQPYPFEWWHFDFTGWEQHPPLDVPFAALR
ncbi:MAG TPA: M15 family metallopeptidase [Chthoniobacteraceae bacterium]|nr:M15 family metallopeptidase [Chthoniobacteraceae bacterium]